MVSLQQHVAEQGGGEACEAELKGGPYWSLMFEVTESEQKPVESSMVDIGDSSW